MNDNNINKNIDMATILNYKKHAEQLNVPVLNDLQVEKDENPQTILLASGHGITEQFISDGNIAEGDFDKRIELVISNTKEFMKNNNCENVEGSFIFHKEYNNGTFNFKLYFQDLIIPLPTEKRAIRILNAYFVEPKLHDFYQFSLSAGPFTMPTEQLQVGNIDLESDQVTIALNNMMKYLLDNLKYKD